MPISPSPTFSVRTQTPSADRWDFLSSLLALAAIAIAGYGAFLGGRCILLKREISQAQISIQNTTTEINRLTAGQDSIKIMDLTRKIQQADAQRIKWSEIMAQILQLETRDIEFTNFSATPEKQISIDGNAADLETIAKMLESLKKNEKIRDPFVSSAAINDKSENGSKPVQFHLTFYFAS